MFRKIVALLFLLTATVHAQFTIEGEMQPPGNHPYMIVYQLKGSQQNYIAHDTINNGKFSVSMPANQASGIYRLVYDIKNRLSVDILYENENVSLTFNPRNPEQSILFSESENNIIYQNYLSTNTILQQKLDSLQVAYFNSSSQIEDGKIRKAYQKNYTELTDLQLKFEKESDKKLVHNFIKASARHYAEKPIKNSAEYLATVKNHFFDNINFNNKALLNSIFINEKINDFIFSLDTSDDKKKLLQLRKKAIATVMAKIGTNYSLAKDIEEGLIYAFTQQEDIIMVNNMLNYYLQLPNELQDGSFINDMKGQLKTATGMLAPNISWQENGLEKTLHSLTNSKNYIVVFWSSTCGHCLQELPLLNEFLKGNTETKVIAVGLEEETSKAGWQNEISIYKNWIHVYGADKWENKFAREYGVNATPSFYVLDAKKKILSKPDDVAELKKFFEKE